MLPLLSCAQMRALDASAIAAGIPGMVLMENAATFALGVILKENPAFVPVFCGKGNNGGDGFALARRLFVSGIRTEIVLCADRSALSGDAKQNFAAAVTLGVPVSAFADFSCRPLPPSTLLVDALLGTGIRGEVQGLLREAIDFLNQSGCPVFSLDMPSGISGDTGKIQGTAVMADKTLTFGYRKLGQYSPLSIAHMGEILCDNISIPAPRDCTRFLVEKSDAALPPIPPAAHKGMRGHGVIIGGSVGMAGAPLMAAQSAEKAGAGLVTVMVPPALLPIMMMRLTGGMCASLEDPILEKANAVLVGPGLGRKEDGYRALQKAVGAKRETLVIDADGLYHLAGHLSLLKDAADTVILTPHFGEMARLCNMDISAIEENRVEIAEAFARTHGVTVVLKGPHTVVAEPDGNTYIGTTGNAGMAKGGSGDILAGIILGLAAQRIEGAAHKGVYLHGLAGDMAAAALGKRAVCPTDLENFLSQAIKCM